MSIRARDTCDGIGWTRIYAEDGTPQRIMLGLVSLEHGRSNTYGGSLIPSIVTSYI